MKVLFAVNNDEISEAILKKYQKEFKEILSYKNVYYFNAIIKELQRDKSYDRVVISEDLEPFTNNNYDTIDKFLFEKLDVISDEATDEKGNNTEIILICNDRRTKSDDIIIKYFGIGIYSALIGQERKIDEVCRLINKPRSKRDAKQYYKIDAENVNYQAEDENNVSEAEVQNILAHYKRLGKDEDRYIDSFNNIVSQYNDNQLRIIINCLPMGVKAVLEERSPKYQELMTFSGPANRPTNGTRPINTGKIIKQNEPSIDVKMLDSDKAKMTKPVVIPTGVNKREVKRLIKDTPSTFNTQKQEDIIDDFDEFEEFDDTENVQNIQDFNNADNNIDNETVSNENTSDIFDIDEMLKDVDDINDVEDIAGEEMVDEQEEQPVKRGRGRPKKVVPVELEQVDKPKRGRGRPRKNPIPEPEEEIQETAEDEGIDLFGLDDEDDTVDVSNNTNNTNQNKTINSNVKEEDDDEGIDLFGLDDEDDAVDVSNNTNNTNQNETINSNVKEEDDDEGIDLFGLDDEDDIVDVSSSTNNTNQNKTINSNVKEEDDDFFDLDDAEEEENSIVSTNAEPVNTEFSRLLTKDKKVISFVGTTKNGTSFVVNNLAELLASMGIKTAVLDLTKSRNAFYIYTNNEERLRLQAEESIPKLKNGIADGVMPNKNLGIYTAVPTENMDYSDGDLVLSTLVKNYSVVLIDCDFDTPLEYFEKSQEIFLVQSMDVLTIQPLTAFLRNLKSKGILRQDKIKVVINKFQKVRNLSEKVLIGGIAFYNDPGMSYMTELFNKDIVPYTVIPFETQNYVKYLESLAVCSINLNGYTKTLINALKNLANLAYPLINKQTFYPRGERYQDNFTDDMNNTLNKMKKYQ